MYSCILLFFLGLRLGFMFGKRGEEELEEECRGIKREERKVDNEDLGRGKNMDD